ncbi:MAG: ABC transporter ATP-binding protein [Flavobacteriales bacterium]|nr:ABC transporter ATP-binding protein [Flavobacteriales bacterium]
MRTLLSTRSLSVGHGTRSLIQDIDLELRAGELVALIGINGGGKSTLMNTLTGLHQAMSGEVLVEGIPLRTISAAQRARRIALVLTGRPQVGLLDVRTLVALGRQPWTGHFGRLSNEDHRRIEEAMEATQVSTFAERSLQHLSDGEAQRVMIARALAQDAPVIILDEPMAFLDLVHRVRLLRLLGGIARERDKAILLSTHDLQSALDLCDRVLLIHGSSLWSGTTQEARSSGVLEAVFAGEGLRFDAGSGSFRSV